MYDNVTKWFIGSTLGLALAGCGGNEEGAVGFRVMAKGTAQQALSGSAEATLAGGLTMSSSDGHAFVLSHAQVNLRDIELDLPEGTTCASIESQLVAPATCASVDDTDGGSSEKVVMEGPFVVDLLAGTSSPDLSQARVPAGIYKRIDFRIDDAKTLPETHELFERSFVARADFEHESQPTTLELALRFNEDHRIEAPEGVEVSGEEGELTLQLDPAQWLQGAPVGTCLAEGKLTAEAGVVRIDDELSSGCSDVENTLKVNIKRSADLSRGE